MNDKILFPYSSFTKELLVKSQNIFCRYHYHEKIKNLL